MAFTKVTDPADNITNQPNQPIIGATALKALFDETGKDLKTYLNDVLTVELEKITDGDSGADNIGATPLAGGVANTVQGILEESDAKINSQLPTPPDSITNAKLAADVKVGSLASLSALLVGFTSSITVAINKIVTWIGDLSTLTTTVKTSLVGSINEVDSDVALKANKIQEAWIIPTLLNGWVVASTGSDLAYFKDEFGMVNIKPGIIKSGTTTSGTVIFTLPSGYRPNFQISELVFTTAATGKITIETSGQIQVRSVDAVGTAFTTISFRAV